MTSKEYVLRALVRSKGGFTLAETMIVISISVIFAITALTKIDYSWVHAEEDNLILKDTLLQARNSALTREQCVTVLVQNRALRVESYDQSSCVSLVGSATSQRNVELSSAATLTPFSSGNPLVFNPDGSTLAGSVSEATLSTTGRTFKVRVYPAIGQIEIN